MEIQVIIGDQVVEAFESLIRRSVGLIINGSLDVCREVVKFLLILLMLYYFTFWSFQLLDEILVTAQASDELVALTTEELMKSKSALEQPKISETRPRIGAPDTNLVNERAGLLKQLEIEAEFEENLNKLAKSETGLEKMGKNKQNIDATSEGELIAPSKDFFISVMEGNSTETSRPSQTVKTSLGKKSKLKENNDLEPTTSNAANSLNQDAGEKLVEKINYNKTSESDS